FRPKSRWRSALPLRLTSFYPYAAHPDLHSFPTRRSSDLAEERVRRAVDRHRRVDPTEPAVVAGQLEPLLLLDERELVREVAVDLDRKSTRLNSSHVAISYAVFCLKKKKTLV